MVIRFKHNFKGIKFLMPLLVGLCLWLQSSSIAIAQTIDSSSSSIEPYLERVASDIQEWTLDNGMKFIVLEDREAPVVSFVTYVDVGGVDEPEGQTGVAHFLEHLAFKGTRTIGTTNYEAEERLLNRVDQIFDQIKAAQAAGNAEKAQELQAEFNEAQLEAGQYVEQNMFGQIVETAGGVGLNAATSADYTMYFYSFPANKVELWMSLESDRFLDPVFREFYTEKEVILEERRLRTDNSPIGQMIEAFLDTAFTEHPYRRPVIGYPEDLRNLTRQNVEDFFQAYYAPSNITVAIVGDVDPNQVKELSQTYFGRYQAAATPTVEIAPEPPQTEGREVELNLASQPWYLEGYHRPSINDADNIIYEVITTILSTGRTSRLYKNIVEQQQLALSVQGLNGFPGDKYNNLLLIYALTAPGHTVDEVAAAIESQIERLKTEPVPEAELERAKTQIKANLLRLLDSNTGMARLLAEYEAKTGDWHSLFEQLETLEQLTAADVQRVAQATFTPQNRTVGRILPQES